MILTYFFIGTDSERPFTVDFIKKYKINNTFIENNSERVFTV